MSIFRDVIHSFLGQSLVKKIVILFGFSGFFCFVGADVYKYNLTCSSICKTEKIIVIYLQFFGLTLSSIACYFWLLISIWLFDSEVDRRKSIIIIAAGVILGLVYTINWSYSLNKISDSFDNTQHIKSLVLKVYEGASSNLDSLEGSIEEKNKESINSAEVVFKLSGTLMEVIDHQGHRVMFEPSPQDLKNRQSVEVIESGMQSLLDLLKLAVIWSWVLFLGSIIAGVVARRFYQSRAS